MTGRFWSAIPDPDHRIGTRMPDGSPWYRTISEDGGIYSASDDPGGDKELVAAQPLRSYPMVVNVADLRGRRTCKLEPPRDR